MADGVQGPGNGPDGSEPVAGVLPETWGVELGPCLWSWRAGWTSEIVKRQTRYGGSLISYQEGQDGKN